MRRIRRAGCLVCLVLTGAVSLVAQQEYPDTITVQYRIEQIRDRDPGAAQEPGGELNAGEPTTVRIRLAQKDVAIATVPDTVLSKAEDAMDLPARNICLLVDISGSTGDVINSDTGEIRLDLIKDVCVKLLNEVVKENDLVSVIAFYSEPVAIIEHHKIRSIQDRQGIIGAINNLSPIPLGNTYMRKALEKAYSVMHTLNTWEGAGSYEPWILLLTDGEETEQPVEQIKATVNEQVQQMRDEGIGMGVSTVSFSKDADRTHMNRIAELGGGSHLFIEQEDLLPSTPRLAVLVIEQTALQDYLTQVWKNTEFDITVVLKEGVSLNEDTLKPYNGKLPAIQDCELVYSQVKLGDLLAVDVSLSEELVQEKGAILSLSITSRDKSFSLLENYPLSLNHPVVAEYKRTLVTFSIRGEKK